MARKFFTDVNQAGETIRRITESFFLIQDVFEPAGQVGVADGGKKDSSGTGRITIGVLAQRVAITIVRSGSELP